MDPLKFPSRDVPLIGQPLTIHPNWLMAMPILCNCEAKSELTVMFGPGLPPAVCPACMNVYGVTEIAYNPARNVPLRIVVAPIGKAQREITDDQVAEKVSKIAETVN